MIRSWEIIMTSDLHTKYKQDKSFDDEGGLFRKIGKIILEPSLVKRLKQLIAMFAPPIAVLLDTAIIPRKVEDLFEKTVAKVSKYRIESNVQRNDFLQLVINQKKSTDGSEESNEVLTNHTITAHATSFFVDGYETSSIAMSFIGYQLAVHPEIQKKLRDVVSTVLKQYNGMTYEALQKMPYLDNVCYESMRLHPPLGSMFKFCTKETKLEGPDGITCTVTPGTPIIIPITGIHRDPKYWPDPEKFDPDRFTEENKSSRPKFTYLAFGEGPRICIGMRMALLQIKAVFATMVNNYTIELSPKTIEPIKLSPYYFLASAVGRIWVQLKPV